MGTHNNSKIVFYLAGISTAPADVRGKIIMTKTEVFSVTFVKFGNITLATGFPVKSSDLMNFFYRKRIWVCPSCKKGDYKYKGEHWKIPDGEDKITKVTFKNLIPTPDMLAPNDQKIIIREHKFSNSAEPILRRRNADPTSLKIWLRRRDADCESSLRVWLEKQREGGDFDDSSPF